MYSVIYDFWASTYPTVVFFRCPCGYPDHWFLTILSPMFSGKFLISAFLKHFKCPIKMQYLVWREILEIRMGGQVVELFQAPFFEHKSCYDFWSCHRYRLQSWFEKLTVFCTAYWSVPWHFLGHQRSQSDMEKRCSNVNLNQEPL